MERIARNIVNLRRKAGMSQETLADSLSVTRQAVSKWERDEAQPDTETLIAIAKIYNISLDTLLTEDITESVHDRPPTDEEIASSKAVREYEDYLRGHGSRKPDDDAYADTRNEPRVKVGDAEVNYTVDDGFDMKVGDARIRLNRNAFPYPLLVTLAYLALGFLFGWWHPTWMLFLTIPIYYTLPNLSPGCNLRHELNKFCYPVLVVIVYLLLGFYLYLWVFAAVLFITIPLYYVFVNAIQQE